MSQKKLIEEEGSKAPAYLVTFSALMTLLMLFFVLLLTMAEVQDAGGLGKGRYAETQESFSRSIRTLGLGTFFAKKKTPDFGAIKIKYFIDRPDEEHGTRTIDAKKEDLSRIFQEVTQSVDTMASQIVAKRTNFTVTNIRFSTGEVLLNESAKKFLSRFSRDMQQNSGPHEIRFYVLGLAREEQTEKEQWILSAQRAQAVADFLNDILPSHLQWPVYSWGAGPGGHWVTHDSLISDQSQILIAVLRVND